MDYVVRNARKSDLDRIQEIYQYARAFMAQTGNPNQWGSAHPPKAQLEQDIDRELLHVMERDGEIHGVFYYYLGEDPTYAVIQDGAWQFAQSYGTIHRIAGDGSGGVLHGAVEYALAQCPYLRIDTHADNRVMQNALHREGFAYCGVIHLADGSPRLAFDRLEKQGKL